MPWTPADIPSQTGKRILITGSNSGIGFYAALELARHGAHVLLACRDLTRGHAAIDKIRAEVPAASLELLPLDLSSLASVHALGTSQTLPLDVLINNAGVMAPSTRRETEDGFELQFGTNVLGHFALTCCLVRQLALVPAARVVTLASVAHKRGRIDFDDLQSEKKYSPMGAYQQSKLADLMFAFELERKLRASGSSISSIAVHPGVAETPLFKVGCSQGLAARAELVLQRTLGLLFNSGPEGAIPTLFAAASPDAKGGAYYGPQGFQELRGGDVGPARIATAAQDTAAQLRLWQTCATLTHTDL